MNAPSGGDGPGGREPDVLVVGAGPAGLAAGACLSRLGLRPLLLERGEAPGWSWARHYETLRLHTPRRSSSLPFLPLPRGGTFPSRAEMETYLAAYARDLELDVLRNVEVRRVARNGDGRWAAETSAGSFRARACVVATGANRIPRIPPIPGRELFRGPVFHSGSVRSVRDVGQGRVLVVGLGNSGGDLAAALTASGARVSIAAGHVSPVLPLRVAGVSWRTATLVVPGLLCSVAQRLGAGGVARRASAALWAAIQEKHAGDLRAHGLGLPSREELANPATWSRPPFTSEAVLSAIRRGEIRLLPRLAGLKEGGAILEGGGTVETDAVLLATGFRHGLEEILPGLVAADDEPADGELEGARGLYLCGFAPELRRISRAARAVARNVKRSLG